MQRLELHALPGLPMVRAGDDLAALIEAGLARAGLVLRGDDVLVLAQKIVSKAEGRSVPLASVTPSARAQALGAETGKDPRLVELILAESVRVVRARPNLVIVEHRLGFVMANAGIDQSNLGQEGHALLLPRDPDGSAAALSARLGQCSQELPGRVIAHLQACGMAARIGDLPRRFSAAALLGRMRQDKKAREGALRFVLLRAPGEAFTTGDVPVDAVERLLLDEGCDA